MKILVIFTGGTIGSSLQEEWVSLDGSTGKTLINNYLTKFGNDVKFDVFTPYSILSENLTGNEISILIKCVNEYSKKDYDGIIVTHGTDTIQYSAAALTYTLEKKNFPVVVVSANYPLDSIKSNGDANFEAAVAFIKEKAGNGVYVSYKNSTKNITSFHYGTRLLAHMETFDDLYSINCEAYAYYDNGKIVLNNDFTPVESINPIGNIELCPEPEILVINSHPGDSFHYDLARYKAVIISPYHSSTINTANKKLVEFCEYATKIGIPIFVVNLRSEFIYESSKLFEELSLIKLPLCCFAAIYIKLWFAISCRENIVNFMLTPLSGEFLN